jgi:hypothetical protein
MLNHPVRIIAARDPYHILDSESAVLVQVLAHLLML